MEIILGLVLVALGAYFFYFRNKNDKKSEPVVEVPYKVEASTPEPTKCGCGRSPTGYCVGLHKLTETEWATHADNPNKVVSEDKPVKAKKVAKPKATKEKEPKKTVKSKSDVRASGIKRVK